MFLFCFLYMLFRICVDIFYILYTNVEHVLFFPRYLVGVWQFVHGQREGVGRWTAKEGQIYVGEWKAGRKSGVGQLTEPDGTGWCIVYSLSTSPYSLVFNCQEHRTGATWAWSTHYTVCVYICVEYRAYRCRFPVSASSNKHENPHTYSRLLGNINHGNTPALHVFWARAAYSGEWHEGLFAGEGTLTLPNGERFEGESKTSIVGGPLKS